MRNALRLSVLLAIGVAAIGAVPVSAQDAEDPGPGGSAETATDAEEPQAQQRLGNSGVFVAVPSGKVWVGPEQLDGGPSYVRRTKASEGMAIVEVSATPFMAELPGGAAVASRPAEQPAPW